MACYLEPEATEEGLGQQTDLSCPRLVLNLQGKGSNPPHIPESGGFSRPSSAVRQPLFKQS